VRYRHAKGGIEVAAFVADRELKERAPITYQHLLHGGDEGVELLICPRVFIVDPRKA
jgi:hypothetical protein